jgi:hypothetical protein
VGGDERKKRMLRVTMKAVLDDEHQVEMDEEDQSVPSIIMHLISKFRSLLRVFC